MKSFELSINPDGSWTARIFSFTFNGSREECVAWLRNQGEEA